MPTIRIELYKGKDLKDNHHPVCVMVTHKGKVKRKTIASATELQWDAINYRVKPRSRPDFADVNRDIDDAWDKYKAIYKNLRDSGRDWESGDVFKEQLPEATIYFKENALLYLSTIKNIFSYDSAKSKYDKILRYTKDNDFSLEEITERWIAGFKNHCKTKEKNNKGKAENKGIGNSDNTINQAIKFLKRVTSFAGVENKALNKTKLTYKEPLLEYPTITDFKNLQALELDHNSYMWHALNIFSIQIYFRGMRIGDALQLEWQDIKAGRLKYDSSKTGHDYDMEILPVASEILNNYKGIGRKYIFPFLKWNYNPTLSEEVNARNKNTEIKLATSMVNNNLKKLSKAIGIGRKISSHQARHMFAIWADEVLNGDIGMIQRLGGWKSRAMAERYIKRLRQTKDLDEAANKVLLGFNLKGNY